MTLRVATYNATMNPNGLKDPQKNSVLEKFATGVNRIGDHLIVHKHTNLIDVDVAIMVGWVHEKSKNASHLNLRRQVIDYQLQRKKYVLVADSNLFLYANTANPLYYLRYSFNGVFPSTGIYCDSAPDYNRWREISRKMNIAEKPWRTTGDHILLCLQRNGGWSMGQYDVQDWALNTIETIRKYSQRPIVIRAHPGDKGANVYLNPANPACRIRQKGVSISAPGRSLIEDLHNAWCVVNHNSSPAIGAAIEGIPVFVTDKPRSQARDIANIDLSMIENPVMPDRTNWLSRLSMFHLNFEDIESGRAWQHMRQWVQ